MRLNKSDTRESDYLEQIYIVNIPLFNKYYFI